MRFQNKVLGDEGNNKRPAPNEKSSRLVQILKSLRK
jgi:hypothetical protein